MRSEPVENTLIRVDGVPDALVQTVLCRLPQHLLDVVNLSTVN